MRKMAIDELLCFFFTVELPGRSVDFTADFAMDDPILAFRVEQLDLGETLRLSPFHKALCLSSTTKKLQSQCIDAVSFM